MFRKIMLLLLSAGLLAGFASVGSALFTSTATIGANSFTAGTVVISTTPTTAAFTVANMAPGDQATAPITVTNGGSLQMRYAITSTVTNADGKGVGAQLQVTIKSSVTTCTNAGFGGSGAIINNGGAAGPLGSLAGTLDLVGDPTTGNQAGDRALAAAANDVLCFNVSLPAGTGNTYQSATTTATFGFIAEQTANN
jgi:hypothetical protein